jgi:hypothetical protein
MKERVVGRAFKEKTNLKGGKREGGHEVEGCSPYSDYATENSVDLFKTIDLDLSLCDGGCDNGFCFY